MAAKQKNSTLTKEVYMAYLTGVVVVIFALQMLCIPLIYFFWRSDGGVPMSGLITVPATVILYIVLGAVNVPLLIWHGIKNDKNADEFTRRIGWALLILSPAITFIAALVAYLIWGTD
ncbi:MAG TPA: hypothetical protein VK694_02310 [Verrucomicrobiae bacterium]|nr:hypothetical protein [Verrucomicrobiae bacterium]